MTHRPVRIAGRRIARGEPVFVIAEAGVNHDGDVNVAHELVDIAANANADAVKFQTFRPSRLVRADAPTAAYQARAGAGADQRSMLERLALDDDEMGALARRARERGILFLATPFDEESADALEALDVPAFKIGSGDLTHHAFLAYVARKARPMIVSTGMATLEEVGAAVRAIEAAGDPPLVLLHCVSSYPAAPDDCDLNAMATLRRAFDVPVGFSDHTLGSAVTCAAVALGAVVIEKHFTTDRSRTGPDHAASLEPDELRALVRAIRDVEASLGDGTKAPRPSEEDVRLAARRSVAVARAVAEGEVLTAAVLTAMRPADGIPANELPSVIGRRAARALPAGARLTWSDVR